MLQTIEEIRAAINAEFDNRSIKTNWPRLEDIIRAIFDLQFAGKLSNNHALYYIALATGAVTKRGEPPFEAR
jgi:hypothetical protein